MGIAKHARVLLVCVCLTARSAADQSYAPEIVSISPTSGPEGTRLEIAGKNFQDASAVLFGTTSSTFKLISPEKLIARFQLRSALGDRNRRHAAAQTRIGRSGNRPDPAL